MPDDLNDLQKASQSADDAALETPKSFYGWVAT